MKARLIHPEEWARTEELFALAFEIPMERKPDAQPDKALHWAAFDTDGEMMSTLTVSDYQIRFDGNVCRMGGIGGVATLPQYRRRGGIRACFVAFLPELYERGYDFSYLYPFSTCFYRQFGYECCVQKQRAKVDLGLLKKAPVSGTYRLAEPGRDLREAVRAVDRVWEATYNMAVCHEEGFYDWVTKLDPAVKMEYCYVWFREDGTPGAYTVYRTEKQPDGRNIQCSKFVFADRAGYQALLQLFKAQASDHAYAKFPLPADAAMRYLMPEWSLGAISWEILNEGMVRVIRVRDVLKKAAYRGTGSAVLEIIDPQIPQNNGRFEVRFEDGKAVSVERTEKDPDAILTIPAFSALISGTCDASDARVWMDGFTVCTNNPTLSQIFYRKKLFIGDYF